MFLLPVPRYLFLYSDLAVLDIISSDTFFIHFFPLFYFWDSHNGNISTQCYLWYSFFFFIKKCCFSFFCSEQMILIVPSASFCMLFIPSSMFYLKFQLLHSFFSLSYYSTVSVDVWFSFFVFFTKHSKNFSKSNHIMKKQQRYF